MTNTTETRTAARSSVTSCFSPFPLRPSPSLRQMSCPSPELLPLWQRISRVHKGSWMTARKKSWCCLTQQDGQGWNLSRLKKTINNQFFRGNQGPKSHMSWEESGDAQGWMQHWKVPAVVRIDVVIVTESLNLFCLPSKSSRHISPSILLTGCISPDSCPQSSWLHLGPSLSLQIHHWFLGWPQSPPLDLILFHLFVLLAWPGSAHHHGPAQRPGLWVRSAHPSQACSAAGLAGKERHLELTQFLPFLALHLTLLSAGSKFPPLQMSNCAEAVAWTRKIVPSTCLSIPSWAEPACPFHFSPDAGESSDKKISGVDGA